MRIALFTYGVFKKVQNLRFWWGESPKFAIFSVRLFYFHSVFCEFTSIVCELTAHMYEYEYEYTRYMYEYERTGNTPSTVTDQ